jgi:hypothetical protein
LLVDTTSRIEHAANEVEVMVSVNCSMLTT